MKKKLFLIAMAFTTTIIQFSCRREFTNFVSNEGKIEKAEAWFHQNMPVSSINPMFKNIKIHWNKANVFTYDNGNKVITVPVTESIQNPEYQGKRSLYLYPWKNGKGYYSTLYEFIPTYKSNQSKSTLNLDSYTGIIAAWDLKKGFTGGIQFENGAAKYQVSIELRKETPVNISLKETSESSVRVMNLPPVTVVSHYPSANWGMFFVTLMDFFGNYTTVLWGNSANPCEYSSCNVYDPSNYFDPNAFTDPTNNDDNDNDPEIKDIVKEIDDTCLSATLDAAIIDGLSNNITDLLKNTFGEKSDFNLKFVDEPLNNMMKDGTTRAFMWQNGRLDITVILNTEVLPDASKEFTTATIYHEIIHAYLRTKGVEDKITQENTIANTYQLQIKSALMSLFPSLDPTEATALSWGGLSDTTAWSIYQTANPTDALNLLSLNAQHRVLTKGTGCN